MDIYGVCHDTSEEHLDISLANPCQIFHHHTFRWGLTAGQPRMLLYPTIHVWLSSIYVYPTEINPNVAK